MIVWSELAKEKTLRLIISCVSRSACMMLIDDNGLIRPDLFTRRRGSRLEYTQERTANHFIIKEPVQCCKWMMDWSVSMHAPTNSSLPLFLAPAQFPHWRGVHKSRVLFAFTQLSSSRKTPSQKSTLTNDAFHEICSKPHLAVFSGSIYESIQSGSVFTIHNVKADTVVDLSAGDNTTVTGWSLNGGKNQQWTTLWSGESWNFQSVATGLYLGIVGTPGNGTNLTVASTPTAWDIWHDTVNETNYRIFVPNTTVNWDLWGYGDATSGDPITLWGTWSGIHQTWRFVQV
ncbi:carbohydrate-binding module family 13 protein [Lentinula edodes]|uniref:Carbohydrate-binding module family 13 protein n=1 Tax=Lentinula edodes TaxID=5353 RepID=A0A1Q3EBM3_LENED|nr:carbohydrate-binding module family 13 protein [Lentinula edodes]